jgi:hypothetical protein
LRRSRASGDVCVHEERGAPGARPPPRVSAPRAGFVLAHALSCARFRRAQQRICAISLTGVGFIVLTTGALLTATSNYRQERGAALARYDAVIEAWNGHHAAEFNASSWVLSVDGREILLEAGAGGAADEANADAAASDDPLATQPYASERFALPGSLWSLAASASSPASSAQLGQQALGAGGGMAARGGADPAALMRLYLRHGALAEAAALATAELDAWAAHAPATARVAPAAAWVAYGAAEAVLTQLRASADVAHAAAADALEQALRRHTDAAQRDAATLRRLAAPAQGE